MPIPVSKKDKEQLIQIEAINITAMLIFVFKCIPRIQFTLNNERKLSVSKMETD